MSFMENIFKGGNLIMGVAIGIGIAIVAPAVIPALRPIDIVPEREFAGERLSSRVDVGVGLDRAHPRKRGLPHPVGNARAR